MGKKIKFYHYAILPLMWLALVLIVADSFMPHRIGYMNIAPVWWLVILLRAIKLQIPPYLVKLQIPLYLICAVGCMEMFWIGFRICRFDLKKVIKYTSMSAFVLWLALLPQTMIPMQKIEFAMGARLFYMTCCCVSFSIFVVPLTLIILDHFKDQWQDNSVDD